MSHAQTLLHLTYETDRALREGRLGAEEWFAFVADLESLACKMENREDPAPRFSARAAKKEKGRVLSFSSLPPSSVSLVSPSSVQAPSSATLAKDDK